VNDPGDLLTFGEAAVLIGCPRREVSRSAAYGALHAIATSEGRRVLRREVVDYIAKRNEAPVTIYDVAEQLAANFRSNEIRPLIHEEKK
jgi:hypothetical protein